MNFWEVVCTSIIIYIAILIVFYPSSWSSRLYGAINEARIYVATFPIRMFVVKQRVYVFSLRLYSRYTNSRVNRIKKKIVRLEKNG